MTSEYVWKQGNSEYSYKKVFNYPLTLAETWVWLNVGTHFFFDHILVSYVYLKYIECVFGLESNELLPTAAIILSVFYGS